jgi:hypothetical protein
MSSKSIATIFTMGIDIGKNSFHVVGLDRCGAIVLRQKWSRGNRSAARRDATPSSAKYPSAAIVICVSCSCRRPGSDRGPQRVCD